MIFLLELLEKAFNANDDLEEIEKLANYVNDVLFDFFVLAYSSFEANIKKLYKEKNPNSKEIHLANMIEKLLNKKLTPEQSGLFHLYRLLRNDLIHKGLFNVSKKGEAIHKLFKFFKEKKESHYRHVSKNISPNIIRWFGKMPKEPNKLSEFLLIMFKNISELHIETS